MNKNIIKISTLLLTSLWVSKLLAGSVTIPNTFVSGTAASASEVNANFSAIKAEVDDNDNRITTNAGDISANAGDISANAANIAANTNAISSIGGVGVFVNGARVGSLLSVPAGNLDTQFSVLSPLTNTPTPPILLMALVLAAILAAFALIVPLAFALISPAFVVIQVIIIVNFSFYRTKICINF